MRKRIVMVCVLLLTASGFIWGQTGDCIATGQGSVNVRAEPNTTAAVLGLIIPTNSAQVLTQQNGWYQVQRTDFGTGWVSGQVVTLTGDCASVMANWNPFVAPISISSGDIVFASDRDGLFNLYAMDASGREVRQLTSQGYVAPVWTPDGTQAVFAADPAHTGFDIYVMNGDGSGIHNLTNDGARNLYPMWSPDGTQIAFYSMRDAPDIIERPFYDDNFSYIYVMNTDGSDLHRLVPPRDEPVQWYSSYESPLGWTGDGHILFASQRDNTSDSNLITQLYSINPDGSDLVNLSQRAGVNPQASTFVTALSPDGLQIAFTTLQSGEADLYVMTTAGAALQQLPLTSHSPAFLSWSPDGTKIAFAGNTSGWDAPAHWNIYLINADGTGEGNLTPGSPDSSVDPHWSPDGSQIVFTSSVGSHSAIFVINAEGTNMQQLTPSDSNSQYPRWLW